MRSTILLVASLFATSFALPQSTQSGTTFFITNFNPGCGDSPAGCLYTFDLTIETPTSSLSTSCEGTDVQGDTFGGCTDTSVVSHEIPVNFELAYLQVNYTFTSGTQSFIDAATADITDFETAGQSFTVTPVTESA